MKISVRLHENLPYFYVVIVSSYVKFKDRNESIIISFIFRAKHYGFISGGFEEPINFQVLAHLRYSFKGTNFGRKNFNKKENLANSAILNLVDGKTI